MKPNEYLKNAERTESLDLDKIKGRVSAGETTRVLHAAMGLSTEAGELLDAVKKHLFYGRPVDVVNIKEEVGDALWYVAVLCNTFGWSLEEIFEKNINKLRLRYPDKFTEERANTRDLDKERELLEE